MDAQGQGQIEVIGAGLGRTGTMSFQAALNKLGYNTYHYPLPDHAEQFAQVADGHADAENAVRLVAECGFTATCDEPMADFFATQLRMFPKAKVVLTVRDSAESWVPSWKVLMRFIEVQERPFSLLYPSFIQWIPFMAAWKRMRNVMGTHLGLAPGELIRGWRSKESPDEWLASQYEAHSALVISTVPKDQLLVFNVKEGWAPLCAFLGKEVPTEPFPFVNESADLKMATTMMSVVTYTWIPALGFTVFGLRRLLSLL
eukprot:m.439239 g.439239  ORF g.439239 m.439239 type:complete len:258 (-) comp18359_c0_seq1:102-875(-)